MLLLISVSVGNISNRADFVLHRLPFLTCLCNNNLFQIIFITFILVVQPRVDPITSCPLVHLGQRWYGVFLARLHRDSRLPT